MHSYRAGLSALLSFLFNVCYALSCIIVSAMFPQQTMAEMGEDVLEERRRGMHLTCLLSTIHVDVIVTNKL